MKRYLVVIAVMMLILSGCEMESNIDLKDDQAGFPVSKTEVAELLDIEIHDYNVDHATIRLKEGVYIDYGGEWTDSTEVNVQLSEVIDPLINLLSKSVTESNVCVGNLENEIQCVIFENISPGSLYLSTENSFLEIHFYNDRYNIFHTEESRTVRIYGVPITDDTILLRDTILETYNLNK